MRIDIDVDAHAGAQQARVLVLVEGDAHGNALHHLDPVSSGVLRRQDGKLRAGAGADRDHGAFEGMVGETVDVERRLLADAQISDVGFLRIGVDPGVLVVDHAQDRRTGGDEAAELNIVDLRRGTGDRRAQNCQIEIALRVVGRGLSLSVFGKFGERQVGIAEQLRQCRVALLGGEARLQFRGQHVGAGGIDIGLRAGLRTEQFALAFEVAPLEFDVLLRQPGQRVERCQIGLQLVVVDARGGEFRRRLRQCQAVRFGIERE